MAIIRVKPGVAVVQDGAYPEWRGSRKGAGGVQDMGGRYEEAAARGALFYAVNNAAQALSLSGTTTYTGLTVANPTASGKNLALVTVAWHTTIVDTGVGSVDLATGTTVAQTAGSSTGPVPTLLGSGAASVAKVGASCTYAANPAFLRPGFGRPWITAVSQAFGSYKDEIAGEIIVPPGQQVSFVAVTTALTGIGYISWEEILI
jgi:hypothetical protein